MTGFANITRATARTIRFTSTCRRVPTHRKSSFDSLQHQVTNQNRRDLRSTLGPSQASQPRARKTSFGLLAASMIAVLLVLLAGFSAWKWWAPSAPLSDKASIAVLPFENIGNDPKWDRFADGITEDIVTDLSHSKDLFVVARNSTEVYRGKPADVRTIGRDLGVRYVLEGSIQPNGDQIRVTAQLIDTRTGGHVWSNRYDRPATDLFNVQSDVTGKIAATLTGYEGAVAAGRTIPREAKAAERFDGL